MKRLFSIPFVLLLRALRYRFLKQLGLPGRVEALSIEITRRCIASCVMCNIWRIQPDSPELDADDWLRLLDSSLFSDLKELDITGGEPFLRKDIVRLLLGIARLKATNLKNLRSIAITTNGFLSDKVLRDVGNVIVPLEDAGISLVFACGFDAVGTTHDRIRNVEGGWEKLNETIEGLVALRHEHPSLVLGIKTTVTRFNIDELDNICRYADDHGLFTIISPYILTSNRYSNLEQSNSLAFSDRDLDKLRNFYTTSYFQWPLYKDELVGFLNTGRMKKPCSAGFNYFFIRSTGEIYCCPIIDKLLGYVQETPFEKLIMSPTARYFRRRILDFPECKTCTEPGLERYALPFEGLHYLRQLLRIGHKKFCLQHRYLGLDKYFP